MLNKVILMNFNIFVSMNIDQLYDIYRQYPSIQTDTRQLKAGDIFFALKGPNFNGNTHAAAALEKGAAFAVIDEEAYYTQPDKMMLAIDVLDTPQQLALRHRQSLDILFLAITGTNGKTTTKELVSTVLSSAFKTTATIGNLNNHIGVPLTILRVPADAAMAVIEMGANHEHEIEAIVRLPGPHMVSLPISERRIWRVLAVKKVYAGRKVNCTISCAIMEVMYLCVTSIPIR